MKYLLLIFSCILLFTCGSDDDVMSTDPGNGGTSGPNINPGDNSGNNPGDTSSELITSNLAYTNGLNIDDFLVLYDGFVISDNSGLHFDIDGTKSSYTEVTYNFQGLDFTTNVKQINCMVNSREGIYIGTTDGHLLVYQFGEFRGVPLYVYKLNIFEQENKIYALWELNESAFGDSSSGFADGIVNTIISLEFENELFLQETTPCLDISADKNYCEGYNISDFAVLDRNLMVANNNSTIIYPYPEYGNFLEYRPNFSNLPYNEVNQIEIFYNASQTSIPPDKFYFNHVWINTDYGLAYCLLDDYYGVIFTDEEWINLSRENSNLSSNSIEDLKFHSFERLVAFSNNPPMLNYINAETGSICSYDLGLSGSISDMHIYTRDVYISINNRIYKVDQLDIYSDCDF